MYQITTNPNVEEISYGNGFVVMAVVAVIMAISVAIVEAWAWWQLRKKNNL